MFQDESYEENEIKELENKCLIDFERITAKSSALEEIFHKSENFKNQLKSTYKKRPLYKLKQREKLNFEQIRDYRFT